MPCAAFWVSEQYTPNAPKTAMPATPYQTLLSASVPTTAPNTAIAATSVQMRTVLSSVPKLWIADRFVDSGVNVMTRLPTAMSGAAAGRTRTATSSPTPSATNAATTPARAPSRLRDFTTSW